MIGVVIVTHGNLASALLDTVELIMGKQEQVKTVAFETGQAVVDLQTRIAQAVTKVDSGRGTIIFVDILGGSPYNASAMLVMEQKNIEIITGVNVPMLFETLPMRTGKLTKVVEVALRGGHDGIDRFAMSRK